MQRHLKIFLAGVMVIAPLGVTAAVVYKVITWLEEVGVSLLQSQLGRSAQYLPGVGVAVVIVGVYLVGLLTRVWLFSGLLDLLDSLISHVPGIKTIYESVRDLLQLFGRGSQRMGRVVRYNMPGTGASTLAVLTNEHPDGSNGKEDHVAVYMPFSYMLGGMTVFVSRKDIEEVDMPVELALKLCATAQVAPVPKGRKLGTEAEAESEKREAEN